MLIIYTRQNPDGSYDEVGMNNRGITKDYKTTAGFLRHGLPTSFYGHTVRLEVFYNDQRTVGEPDKTMFVVK
jgi:hypothetical protein